MGPRAQPHKAKRPPEPQATVLISVYRSGGAARTEAHPYGAPRPVRGRKLSQMVNPGNGSAARPMTSISARAAT